VVWTDPDRDPKADDPGGVLRLVARRERDLLSLSELTQELTIALDPYEIADIALYSIMGQLGTSRAALWRYSEGSPRQLVLVRSHGVSKHVATALGTACAPWLVPVDPNQRVILVQDLELRADAASLRLLRQEGIHLFAPITFRAEPLGVLALGSRIGGTRYTEAELHVLVTSLGMVGGALQNATLYNSLRENNRKLRLANESLKELDRLKSEFLSNVNHELRTPLTIIIAYLSILMDQAIDPELEVSQLREYLGTALSEARKLSAMVENLLEFSSATKETLSLRMETAEVAPCLASYCADRAPGVSSGLRELVFIEDQGLPCARFDRSRLLQIVDSLVSNAVKFTPQGTRIMVRVGRYEEEGSSWVRVEVQDDGPGIPSDRIEALFGSFRQLDGSSTREVGGMGLGLSLAQQLAQMMDGMIRVESEPGRGSNFMLLLPAVSPFA
jgi:signal transduction histidine kinase